MNSQSHFSEAEIGLLMKRATELQEADAEGSGFILAQDEVEAIAAEIGIDPKYLRAAIIELSSTDSSRARTTIWGGPFRTDIRGVIEGELSDSQWEHIVQELRELTGGIGTISELGNAKEWRRILALESTQATARGDQGRTLIRIKEQFKGYATVTYSLIPLLATGITAPIVFGIGFSPVEGIGLIGGVIAGALTVARSIFASRTKKRRANVAELFQRLQMIGAEDPEIAANESVSDELLDLGGQTQEVVTDDATTERTSRRRIRG